eukprot:638092-Amphidinium_carterae.1
MVPTQQLENALRAVLLTMLYGQCHYDVLATVGCLIHNQMPSIFCSLFRMSNLLIVIGMMSAETTSPKVQIAELHCIDNWSSRQCKTQGSKASGTLSGVCRLYLSTKSNLIARTCANNV